MGALNTLLLTPALLLSRIMPRKNDSPAQTSNNATTLTSLPESKPLIRMNTSSLPQRRDIQKMSATLKNNYIENIKTNHEIAYFQSPDILQKIQKISKEQAEFDDLWRKFNDVVKDYFTFKNFMIHKPINDYGNRLLKQGIYIYCWLKILSKNSFININAIGKKIRDELLPSVQHQRKLLQKYLNQISPVVSKQSPKNVKQSLKPILKDSPTNSPTKRVTFCQPIDTKIQFCYYEEETVPFMCQWCNSKLIKTTN